MFLTARTGHILYHIDNARDRTDLVIYKVSGSIV